MQNLEILYGACKINENKLLSEEPKKIIDIFF
jgi:hypothetical protein